MSDKVHIAFYPLVCLLIFISANTYSQYGDIRFELLSKEKGLEDGTIFCITQDSKGFLWVGGGESGLYRYDGYNFKLFHHNPDDPNSLNCNIIYAICEDSSGIIWIGTYGGGLNKFNMKTETFTHYLHQPDDTTSLSDNKVVKIIKDRHGNIWIGTYGGGLNKIEQYNKSDSSPKFIRYKHGNDFSSISGDEIYSLYEDKSGTIWIGTNNGLSRYEKEDDSFVNYVNDPSDPGSLSGSEVYAVLEDDENNLWVGTKGGGLNRVVRSNNDKATLTFMHYKFNPDDPSSISDNSITSIYEDSKGIFWVGTIRGVNIFNRKKGQFNVYKSDQNYPKALSSDIIYSIFEDNSGLVWIGTYTGIGIHKFNRLKEQFNPYRYYLQRPEEFDIKIILPIYEDRNGIIWIGTYGGLYKFDREKNFCIRYSHDPNDPTSLTDNKVNSISEDRLGNIWIGTVAGGLNKFDKKKEEFIYYRHNPNNPNSISSDIILSTYVDGRNTLWIGTYDGGLNKFDIESNEFIHYKNNPDNITSISNNRISSILEDRAGNLWLGTRGGGLNKFDREKEQFTSFKHDSNDSTSISNDYVLSMYEDSVGTLWMGTMGGGLNRFDTENEIFNSYSTSEGLPSETVYGLLEDDRGNFWISTKNGLCKFSPASGVIRNYDASDGLSDDEFNHKAWCKTRSGELIFGGHNGINIFHPDSLKENSHIPPIVITDFHLFNEPVPVGFYEKSERIVLFHSITETSKLELTYEERIFSIEFAALDFHAPEKNKYAYIMEGFEENWNYTDASRRLVTYTNLDPGEYTFRVKASNNHGYWNEEGALLKIIILPPWWATTWAYIIYALLIIGTIYFVWRMQLRRIKIKHDYEMSKFEAEKMHEVDELKSRFFANISHEFRTPLTLIFGPARDIIEECDDNKAQQKAGIIKRNAGRLYSLVNQLLDISKLEAGKMKLEATEQNIIQLLKGYVLSFSSLAERKKIKLNFKTVEENLNVFVDKDKLEKIISNLLSNAFKFTPEGGEIMVSVESSSFPPLVKGELKGGFVEISVSDNGIGIAKERLDKIFDRFYQVDGSHTRESEGTGIGLALTKELVELHRGKIVVESEYGKGTTFKILLPLDKDHLKPEEIVEKEATEETKVTLEEIESIAEVEKKKIKSDVDLLIDTEKPLLLIVEDNKDVREYIISHLEEEYRLLEAANGEEGLQEALKHIPDLIISDVMMPKMDGFELCEKLKTDERTSHIPIILLTAKATDKDKIFGYETGADDYIMKPFDSDVLKVRVKNLIEQRRKLHEHFKREGLIELEDKEITSIDKKFLQSVFQSVNAHLSDTSYNIELLTEEISMNRRNLERKLNALTGETPGDLIRRMRLTHASKLLMQNFGNISEVALEVGFSNPAYFSKCFRDQFGLTPSEYYHNNSK
jgi:signal transduction histidine kinase/ligand-binding sensor domain-containing protein/DNA-binding response OmpR family regulator